MPVSAELGIAQGCFSDLIQQLCGLKDTLSREHSIEDDEEDRASSVVSSPSRSSPSRSRSRSRSPSPSRSRSRSRSRSSSSCCCCCC